MGIAKFPKLGLPRLWGPITLCASFWLRWGLKKSCSPHPEFSNSILHAMCTQGNRVDSWLLMVESQIANLIPGLSFGHNLCFKCPNRSCEPILYIYVSLAFQWYKELFNPLGFDPYNCSLKIQESIKTPNSQSGSSLGSVKVHSLTLSFTPGLPLGPQPYKPFTLVESPRLGLRQLVWCGCRFINGKVANDILLPSSSKERFKEGDQECFNVLKGHLHFAYWCHSPRVDIIIVSN